MRDKHNHEHHIKSKRRGPPGARVRSFVQPRLLFHLAQKPAHGYELMEQLGEEGGAAIDPALLYRTLHQFQEQGFVSSTWDTEGGGPARRVYEITAEGSEYLHAWAVELRRTRDRLDRFLRDYEAYFQEERR